MWGYCSRMLEHYVLLRCTSGISGGLGGQNAGTSSFFLNAIFCCFSVTGPASTGRLVDLVMLREWAAIYSGTHI